MLQCSVDLGDYMQHRTKIDKKFLQNAAMRKMHGCNRCIMADGNASTHAS